MIDVAEYVHFSLQIIIIHMHQLCIDLGGLFSGTGLQ